MKRANNDESSEAAKGQNRVDRNSLCSFVLFSSFRYDSSSSSSPCSTSSDLVFPWTKSHGDIGCCSRGCIKPRDSPRHEPTIYPSIHRHCDTHQAITGTPRKISICFHKSQVQHDNKEFFVLNYYIFRISLFVYFD